MVNYFKTLLISCVIICCGNFLVAQSSKAKETILTETIKTLGSPSAELLKRGVYWVKIEVPEYRKTSSVTSGSKVECTVSFDVKQDAALHPECDYTGKISMKVLIECANNQYKYTIWQIKHTSKSGTTSGGNIDNEDPECGKSVMPQFTWRALKSDALAKARTITVDIKESMMKSLEELEKGE